MRKFLLLLFFIAFYTSTCVAQNDTVPLPKWIKNKISFGRGQHIQHDFLARHHNTRTLLNKAYYASYSFADISGFKPFVSLTYEYFLMQSNCYDCFPQIDSLNKQKYIHYLHYASVGLGVNKTFSVKRKNGKNIGFTVGVSLEHFLFRQAMVFKNSKHLSSSKALENTDPFFNQFYFKDSYGVRIYASQKYKVYILFSGVLLRNERLFYKPSQTTFHNFIMGFRVDL